MEHHRPIIDAGPGLNFLSINQENLLIRILGPMSTPATVAEEIKRKAREDERFKAAGTTMGKLVPKYLNILPDDPTPDLEAVVNRITQLPMVQRQRQAKDLGELMVVAHAVVAAQAGQQVIVLIDDADGARLAGQEIRRLRRLQAQGKPVGAIKLAGTLTILQGAVRRKLVPDKGAMRKIYGRLRSLDDGLVPIEQTELLSNALWQ
ncbi:hypothetical protein ACFV4N_11205 [Actinosynnema sp. NPDC059797]